MRNIALENHIDRFNFANTKNKKNRERLSDALSFMEQFYRLQDGEDPDGSTTIKAMNGLFGEGKDLSTMYGDDEDRGIMLELDVDDGKGVRTFAGWVAAGRNPMRRSLTPDEARFVERFTSIAKTNVALTEIEQRFVQEYVRNPDEEQAAIAACYGNDVPRSEGRRLIRKGAIRATIGRVRKARSERAQSNTH